MIDDGELRTDSKRVRTQFSRFSTRHVCVMQLVLIWERAPKVNTLVIDVYVIY